MLCCAVLCCAVLSLFCLQRLILAPWHTTDSFKHVNVGCQTVETSVAPTATTEDQSSSDRNARQAAGSVINHSQQPVKAQGMLSKNLHPESAPKLPQGSTLLTKFKPVPQRAEQVSASEHTHDGTESVVRRQKMLQSQRAQHETAPQHAERRQHAQRAGHSMHAGFTATVSMTAWCRQQSPESWNSNSSSGRIVSHCCATVHSPEVTSSLSIHANLSPRKVSKAVKQDRQGELANQSALMTDQRQLQQQVPKESSLMPGQRESLPAQVQLQQQLPNQSSIAIGQHRTAPAQQLQEQLPTQAFPCATQSPQPLASHSIQQQVSHTVTAKSLSRASSIVAAQQAQQAVSCSSSTVPAEAQREGPKLPQPASSPQQVEGVSCTSPVQLAEQLEPVCSDSSAGSTGQLSSQTTTGKQPVEPKPSVLRRGSSQTPLTPQVSAGQGRARHDGRGGSRTQPSGPQAELVVVPRSDSASSAGRGAHTEGSAGHGAQPEGSSGHGAQPEASARHGAHTEGSSASQSQLAALPRSDSASSALHSMHHTDSCQAQPQPQQQTLPDSSTAGSSRQTAAPPTASTQRPQLRNEVGSGRAHRPQLQKGMHSGSNSSSMQLNSQSDLGVQQEVSPSPPGSSSSISRLFSQPSFTAQQDAQQPDRLSRQKLLLLSCSAQQGVAAQPECYQDNGVSRAEGARAEGLGAEGLALLQEQSQLALATQGSCSELSREGLEEDNCRLRRALAAIEQQLGMIRNQQVTKLGQSRM